MRIPASVFAGIDMTGLFESLKRNTYICFVVRAGGADTC